MRIAVRGIIAVILAILSLGLRTAIADGVLEINQACVAVGCFPGDSAGFPITITDTAGVSSFILTGDLIVPDENTTAIRVQADHITVNLGGFTISGSTTCTGLPGSIVCTPTGTGVGVDGFNDGSVGVVVRNGIVRRMGDSGILLSSFSRAEHIIATDNNMRGILVGISSAVLNSTAYNNGHIGITTSDNSTIKDNIADGNNSHGISTSSGSTVMGNATYNAGGDGIRASFGNTILSNSVQDNNSDGIHTQTGNTVKDNSVFSNDGDGIQTSVDCAVINNTVVGNGGYGLNLDTDSGFAGNVINGNTTAPVNSSPTSMGTNICNGVTSNSICQP